MSELRQIAVIADELDVVRLVRARLDEFNASRLELDDMAELPAGYSSKRTCDPPLHYYGPEAFWNTLQALGIALIAVEDPAATARFAERMAKRVSSNVRDSRAPPSMTYFGVLRRKQRRDALIRKIPWLMTPERARELSKLAIGSMTKAERTKRAKIAAKARWRGTGK